MVFRLLIVGWLLVLTGWCVGQEGQEGQPVSQPPALEHRSFAHRQHVTEVYEIDGEQVQFMVHRCFGPEAPIFPQDPDIKSGSSGAGHVISARSANRVDVLWGSMFYGPFQNSAHSQKAMLTELHWDSAEQRLWVALIGTTNETESSVRVWRLDLVRDSESGGLKVEAIARAEQAFSHKWDIARPTFIGASRFTEEDGQMILNLYHHDRPKTRIELADRMEPSDETLKGTILSQETRIAIRAEARPGDAPLKASGLPIRFERETEAVEVDGHPVRFVMHWASGTEQSSFTGKWLAAGYVVSIVPVEDTNEPAMLWYRRSPMMEIHTPIPVAGVISDHTALWWDESQRCLWIAAAVSWSGSIPRLTVHRLELKHENAEARWTVTGRWSATKQYTLDELRSDVERDATRTLIKTMRFVRTDDGMVDLEIEYSAGGSTRLGLPRAVEDWGGPSELPISEMLVELIRDDLAERRGDGK